MITKGNWFCFKSLFWVEMGGVVGELSNIRNCQYPVSINGQSVSRWGSPVQGMLAHLKTNLSPFFRVPWSENLTLALFQFPGKMHLIFDFHHQFFPREVDQEILPCRPNPYIYIYLYIFNPTLLMMKECTMVSLSHWRIKQVASNTFPQKCIVCIGNDLQPCNLFNYVCVCSPVKFKMLLSRIYPKGQVLCEDEKVFCSP